MNATTNFVLSTVGGTTFPTSTLGIGRDHMLMLTTAGTVKAWGSAPSAGQFGQIGNNTTIYSGAVNPETVWSISSLAVSVACGFYHSLALLSDGTVRAWGGNFNGGLGNGDSTNRLTPTPVLAATSIVAISAGGGHTALLSSDGKVFTCGYNLSGQLGNGNNIDQSTIVQVLGISTGVGVSCGREHVLVVLTDGTVKSFGLNNYGQLGDGTNNNRSTPVSVTGISTAIAVSGGYTHSLILLSNGTIRSFGSNSLGELGVGLVGTTKSTPVSVGGISTAVQVSASTNFSVVLLTNGTVKSFGGNYWGELGVDNTTITLQSTPVTVTLITTAKCIATSEWHTCFEITGSDLVLSCGDFTSFTPDVLYYDISPYKLSIPSTIVNKATVGSTVNYISQNIGVGKTASSFFQLDMSTDGARKLSSTTWTTGSDERIKNNIVTANLERCAEIVDSLDLKYFEWIDTFKGRDEHSLGWIAQDVKKFFPKSVNILEENGFEDFHTLDSDQLIKVLYGAIKSTINEYFPGQE